MITDILRRKNKPIHPDEYPVQTPDIYIYSEILSGLKSYIKETKISHKKLAPKIGVARSTLIETIQLDHAPKTLNVALKYMKFLNVDIDNFIVDKTNVKDTYIDVPQNEIVKYVLRGLVRNMSYRTALYTKTQFLKMSYMKYANLDYVTNRNKYLSLLTATKIAITIKKNFKQIAYDGYIPLSKFKPY